MAAQAPEALTETFRAAEARRAALIAALVARYFQQRVDPRNAATIERWLAAMVPIILAENARSAQRAVLFGGALRRLEVPSANDGFRFEPVTVADLEKAVRTSLWVTAVSGKTGVQPALERISGKAVTPAEEKALISRAVETASTAAAGSALRHVQAGGRGVLAEGAIRDKVALGYVRVTKPDPCYFCAMLESRGVVYKGDSFKDSNRLFDGPGHFKVHDHCGCSLKPLYRRDDPLVDRSKEREQEWIRVQQDRPRGTSQMLAWRRAYENR